MAECVVCGDSEFTRSCSYCGVPVCTDHTLPERHDCEAEPSASEGRHFEGGHDLLEGEIDSTQERRSPEPMEVPEDGVYRTSDDEPDPHVPVYGSDDGGQSDSRLGVPSLPEYWWSDFRAQLFVVLRWVLRGAVLALILVLVYAWLSGGL